MVDTHCGLSQVTRGAAWLTFLAAAAAADGGFAARRHFRGKPSPARSVRRPLGPKLARVARSGIIPMLGWATRDAVPRGLMASCDSFAWRSMHCGTYASANS